MNKRARWLCKLRGCGLQAIACLILFTFANVLSTLLAKMMASHFHKATYFHKMQGGHSQGSLLTRCPSRLWDVTRTQWPQGAAAEELCVLGFMHFHWTVVKQQCHPTRVLIL